MQFPIHNSRSKFNKKDIDNIIELEALIKEAEIKLKSAELVGLVLETTKGIKVTDIYGKEEVLEKGDTWQSDAYMKIEVQDNLSIEIKECRVFSQKSSKIIRAEFIFM